MEPVSFVFSQLSAGFEFDNISLFLAQVVADKLVVIDVAEKAYALTVFAFGTGQSGFLGDGPHFTFHETAEWKHQFGYLQCVELGKKVGLVFDRVDGRAQVCDALLFDNAGIVPCGDFVEILSPILLKEAELDVFVTHDIGIRGEAAFYRVNGCIP